VSRDFAPARASAARDLLEDKRPHVRPARDSKREGEQRRAAWTTTASTAPAAEARPPSGGEVERGLPLLRSQTRLLIQMRDEEDTVTEMGEEFFPVAAKDPVENRDDAILVQAESAGGDDLVFVEEQKTLACAVAVGASEASTLRTLLRRASARATLGGKVAHFSNVLHLDLENQLCFLQKVCSILPGLCSSVRVSSALIRAGVAASASLFFLLSGCTPARCLRFVVGGVYKNALHACILTEVLGTLGEVATYAREGCREDSKNFVCRTSQKLAAVATSVFVASTVPAPLLAGHLIACVTDLLVESTLSSLVRQAAPTLSVVATKINEFQTSIRLWESVMSRLRVKERPSLAEPDWTLTDIELERPSSPDRAEDEDFDPADVDSTAEEQASRPRCRVSDGSK